jgi:TolA-binding protein
VAETHLSAGRKDKAAEILEEIIKTYPKHPNIPDARRLLDQAKKK